MMNNGTTYWIPNMGAVVVEPIGQTTILRYEEASPRVVIDLEPDDEVDLMDDYGNVVMTVRVLPQAGRMERIA